MFGHFLLSLLLQGYEFEKDNGCIKSDVYDSEPHVICIFNPKDMAYSLVLVVSSAELIISFSTAITQ